MDEQHEQATVATTGQDQYTRRRTNTMWTLIGKPTTQKVTRTVANEFANMEALPRDRPLKETRLLVYERLIHGNKFGPMTWAKIHVAEAGMTYRVNGKHTSTLLSRLDPLPELYVTIQ